MICSFWLADCLLDAGDAAGSRRVVEGVIGSANDLVLLSEELQREPRSMLGNFPQAFSHAGHIQTAVRLARAAAGAALEGG